LTRLRTFFIAAAALLVLAGTAQAEPLSARGLNIRVEGEGWGVPSAAIARTLNAVAGILLPHMSSAPAAPIVVTHTAGAPVTLYERGPNGEYLVRLHASGPRWHLYVYEFAHELTHILANYDRHAGPETVRHNQWLEESICETASLFVLDRLATAWAHAPAGDEFAARSGSLRNFYDALVGENHRRLPPGYSFAAWIADNEARLREDPYERKRDDLVAGVLLPLFERDPGGWGALGYLNLDRGDNDASLSQYLGHWYSNVPAVQKPFVRVMLEAMAAK
jgi:hypothetical protein